MGLALWTEAASMSVVRRGPSCGVVKNWGTDKEEVVAAGGYKPWVVELDNQGVSDEMGNFSPKSKGVFLAVNWIQLRSTPWKKTGGGRGQIYRTR